MNEPGPLDFMPPPTGKGVLFNLAMLAAPWIGLAVGGRTGLLAGAVVSCVGLSWFFFKPRRGNRCEVCRRRVANMKSGSPLADQMGFAGAFVLMSQVRSGAAGPGHECRQCGRIYCSSCGPPRATCACGAFDFRSVALRYFPESRF
jgi:hypothetical protein